MKFTCELCSLEFEWRKRSDRKVKFCSRSCFAKSKIWIQAWNKWIPMSETTKEKLSWTNSVHYKTWRVTSKRWYVLYLDRKHSRNNKWYVYEHILVAEKALWRPLKKFEVIHHINEVLSDNRIENLFLFPSHREHMKYHANERWWNVDKISESNLT